MELVKISQNTSDWIIYRRMHIGASEASICLGINPWKSPLQLYEEKIFNIEQKDNCFMARGRELEPLALECFEKETGLSMFPMVFKHDSIEWMMASLDGITMERDAIVEIKLNGKKNHELALQGKIPRHYEAQIQHQLEVTGLDLAFYYSFTGEKGVIIEVKRDQDFIDILLEKEREFWHCLQTLKPPSMKIKTNTRIQKEVLI